jgi:hypothetical protein
MLTLTHALDHLRYGMGRKMTFLRWQLDWIPLPSIDYSKTNFIKVVSRAGAHFVQSTAWDSEMSSAESRHPRWIVLAPKFLDEEMRQLTGKSLLSANMAKPGDAFKESWLLSNVLWATILWTNIHSVSGMSSTWTLHLPLTNCAPLNFHRGLLHIQYFGKRMWFLQAFF